jgi:predicted XRE-type DNA-binding protein
MVKKSSSSIQTPSTAQPTTEPLDTLGKLNPDLRKFFRQTCTQAEFGQLVGISQQAVSDLMRRGVLPPGLSRHAWLTLYLTNLREEIIARQSSSGSHAR